ncbi:hypothetical protein [Hymenobacter agri]
MNNAAIIARLQEIGPLPDDSSPAIDTFPLQKFDELLQQLSEPLEPSHSLALINLGPPHDASTYEVEWALVHAAENISAEALRDILPLADDTEVRRIIEIRLANYFKSNPE